MEDTQSASQAKLQEFIAQTQLYDHEKHISEKNRISSLQREIESYQKNIIDLENKNRNANFEMLKEVDSLKQENTRYNDLYQQAQKSQDTKDAEIKNLRREIDNLQDELYYLQKKTKDINLQRDETSNKVASYKENISNKEGQLLREALSREDKLKNKIVKLKAKLREANKKIMELLPLKMLQAQ